MKIFPLYYLYKSYDIEIKTKCMDTQRRVGLRPRSPFRCLACGLTHPPDHCVLESECVYVLLDMFVTNSVELGRVSFSHGCVQTTIHLVKVSF